MLVYHDSRLIDHPARFPSSLAYRRRFHHTSTIIDITRTRYSPSFVRHTKVVQDDHGEFHSLTDLDSKWEPFALEYEHQEIRWSSLQRATIRARLLPGDGPPTCTIAPTARSLLPSVNCPPMPARSCSRLTLQTHQYWRLSHVIKSMNTTRY